MPVDLYGFLLTSWIPINIFMLDVYRMQAARLGEHHVDYGMSLYRMSQYKELLSLIGQSDEPLQGQTLRGQMPGAGQGWVSQRLKWRQAQVEWGAEMEAATMLPSGVICHSHTADGRVQLRVAVAEETVLEGQTQLQIKAVTREYDVDTNELVAVEMATFGGSSCDTV